MDVKVNWDLDLGGCDYSIQLLSVSFFGTGLMAALVVLPAFRPLPVLFACCFRPALLPCHRSPLVSRHPLFLPASLVVVFATGAATFHSGACYGFVGSDLPASEPVAHVRPNASGLLSVFLDDDTIMYESVCYHCTTQVQGPMRNLLSWCAPLNWLEEVHSQYLTFAQACLSLYVL